MTCERYWRDGVLLVERGEPDPHRDGCVACQREHAAREAIVRALPLIGRDTAGERRWEARVWRQVAQLESRRRRRGWLFGAGLAAAFALGVLAWALTRSAPPGPRIDIAPGPDAIAMRSTSPEVGDRIRITAALADEVRVYRGDRLVLRCRDGVTGDGCRVDARGMVAEALLVVSGRYRVAVITSTAAAPVGRLDLDLRAIVAAGGDYQLTELDVR